MGIKKFLLSKVFIGSAAGVVVAATATAAVLLNQVDAYRIIKVFDFQGTSIVERADEPISPFKGMNLESGDSVFVKEESSMKLTLDDDKYVTLDENTSIDLIATGTAADSKTEIYLSEGSIFNEITKPLSDNSTYKVNTPKATMAVRGTSFRVTVENDEDGSYITNIEVTTGKVEVQLIDENGNPKEEPIMITAGQSISIKTDQTTTNDATIDGNSYFVIYNPETGEYIPLFPEEEAPEVTTTAAETTTDSPETTTEETTTAAETTTTTTAAAMPVGTINVTAAPIVSTQAETRTTTTTTAITTTEKPAATTSEVTTTKAAATTTTTTEKTTTITTTTERTASTTQAYTTPSTTPHVTTVSVTSPITVPIVTTTAAATTTTESIAKTYIVDFINADGTVYKSEEVEIGKTVSVVPEVPASTEYEENSYTAKWTVNGSDFDANAPITADTAVTAVYTLNTYTVYFKNGDMLNSSVTVKHGSTVITPNITAAEGYTGAWVYEDGTPYSDTDVIKKDTTIKFVQTAKTYTITYVYDGATVDTREIDHDDTLGALPEFPAYGDYPETAYTAKWLFNGEEVTADTVVTGPMEIEAEYTLNKYNVTFVNYGTDETIDTLADVVYGTVITLPAGITNAGVWRYDSGEMFADGDIVEEDAIINFIPTYTIAFYNVSTGDLIEENTKAEHGSTISSILPEVAENGVWRYGTAYGEIGELCASDAVIEGEATILFIPVYEATLTYRNASGETSTTQNVELYSSPTTPDDLVKYYDSDPTDEYDYDMYFVGWSENILYDEPEGAIQAQYIDKSSAQELLVLKHENGEFKTVANEVYVSSPTISLTDLYGGELPINQKWFAASSGTIDFSVNSGKALHEEDSTHSDFAPYSAKAVSDSDVSVFAQSAYFCSEYVTFTYVYEECTGIDDFTHLGKKCTDVYVSSAVLMREEPFGNYDIQQALYNAGYDIYAFSNITAELKYYDSSGTEVTFDQIKANKPTEDYTVKISITAT